MSSLCQVERPELACISLQFVMRTHLGKVSIDQNHTRVGLADRIRARIWCSLLPSKLPPISLLNVLSRPQKMTHPLARDELRNCQQSATLYREYLCSLEGRFVTSLPEELHPCLVRVHLKACFFPVEGQARRSIGQNQRSMLGTRETKSRTMTTLDAMIREPEHPEDCTCCDCNTLTPRLLDAEAQATANILKALADPTRLQILDVLCQQKRQVCVCDLEGIVGLPDVQTGQRPRQSTISHHLKILRNAGLVGYNKRGLWVYYYVEYEQFAAIQAVLEAIRQPQTLTQFSALA